jgi:NAD(P)-dependent dehydrogenase (short-subunit alcohol dehydrogenase family)
MATATRVSVGLSSLAIGAVLARQAWRARQRYSFKGRTVLIVGGSRGLGLEIARQLAAEGARLWLVARSPQALLEAADELREIGAPFVETVAADVRHEEDIDRVVERVLRAGDGLDVLVNNAGVIEVGPFEHAQIEDFEDSLRTHFWAPLHFIRKFLPHIRRVGDGRVINISSVGGRVAVPHLPAYAAGKFALTGLSETLRIELQKSGISVTTVTPGLMRTGSYVNVRLRGRHADEFRWFAAMAATPFTSMQARRAAAQIIKAARDGRAVVSPAWQARMAQVVAAVAPNTTSAIEALANRTLLPSSTASASGDVARSAAHVDPGAVKTLLSARTRRRYRQQRPAWS